MDAGVLKTCHRELGHIVFDAKEKVTARRISNNWDVDNQTAMEVLQKWIDEQKEKAKLSVEYIVRGVDKMGNMFMTVVKEEKLANVCKLYPSCVKMLYSVEVASDIRPMNVSLDSEFNVKKLRLEPQKRQIEHRPAVPGQSEPPAVVKQEQKPGKKNLFSTVSSKPAAAVPVKEEKTSPPATPAPVKAEPQTPTSSKGSPKKQSPKKDTKKVVNGKGSISSFFSSKPGQPAPKVASAGSSVKQEPESPASSTSESTPSQKQAKAPAPAKPEPKREKENARKRTISSDEDQDVIPNTPQEEKREAKKRSGKPVLQRKKTANPSKKSRLLQICDSSSDDETDAGREEAAEEGKKERLVEFDEEMDEPSTVAEKQQSQPSPEKPVENDSNSANRNRGKVRKMVTKTFTDDDGYLITVKEWEMVSEDESQEKGSDKETSVPSSVPAAKGKSTSASQGKAASGEKKETPPTPKTKQGSIMSFFAKK